MRIVLLVDNATDMLAFVNAADRFEMVKLNFLKVIVWEVMTANNFCLLAEAVIYNTLDVLLVIEHLYLNLVVAIVTAGRVAEPLIFLV